MTKTKKYILIKQGDRLIPFDNEDSLAVAVLKEGERVVFEVGDVRKIERHRKYFKLLSEVINHMPEQLSEKYPKPENLLDEIKLQLGYYEKHYTLSGREVYKPKSISFVSMGEKKFQQFVSDSKNILLKYFLIGVSPEQFDQNFMSLIFR
jgi:hypothetical protein